MIIQKNLKTLDKLKSLHAKVKELGVPMLMDTGHYWIQKQGSWIIQLISIHQHRDMIVDTNGRKEMGENIYHTDPFFYLDKLNLDLY